MALFHHVMKTIYISLDIQFNVMILVNQKNNRTNNYGTLMSSIVPNQAEPVREGVSRDDFRHDRLRPLRSTGDERWCPVLARRSRRGKGHARHRVRFGLAVFWPPSRHPTGHATRRRTMGRIGIGRGIAIARARARFGLTGHRSDQELLKCIQSVSGETRRRAVVLRAKTDRELMLRQYSV
ncbi:hypothetical protein FPV16_01670 [Methylobacterium sp. W2]|uniref:hypothetical protein n=1 Tax=Methylobacterium sp. W2 TaxID=2598107 RepID=UPI001D0C206F|nr:hypothetical protein [Methylobacterium sp. W2]MCC0804940.1 hypothetical protein [Methylobacterium sp. W2]